MLNTTPVVSGTNNNDILEVTPQAGGDLFYQFLDPTVVGFPPIPGTQVTLTAPVPGLTFNGRGGDDVMIVNANANPFAPIIYNGGDHDFSNPPTPANGDALLVNGSGQDAVYAPDDGRVLGAQAVGAEGVDKRLDVVATALAFGASVRDLAGLDLAYAPPYGAAKDPIHMAAFAACNDDLLNAGISFLHAYYRPETLASDLARRVFLMPEPLRFKV